MARLNIDGIGVVEVDDGFKDLSPEEQQRVVDHIKAEHAKNQGGASQAPSTVGGARPEGPAGSLAGLTKEQQAQVDGLSLIHI